MARSRLDILSMHILVVVQDFVPETGAGPARIVELATEWIRAGHRVTVVTGFPSRRLPGQRDGLVLPPYRGRVWMKEVQHEIQVLRSWLYTSTSRGVAHTLVNNFTFAGTALLNALFVPRDVDVVIASGPPYFAQFAGAAAAITRRVPLVTEIRDLWPDYVAEMGIIRSRSLLRAMFLSERWLLRQSDAVAVVTESFRTRLVAKGIAAEMIHVLPNGVDTARYFPDDELSRAPATSGGRRPRIGYLGTFGAGQGLLAVVEAARRLEAQGFPVVFDLVGDGPQRHALEADLAGRPVPNVRLHPPIPRDQTRDFYNSCDVVLVPHASLGVLGDTVPSKIFEVMGCGRPLVGALRGEGARIVSDSGAGLVATPEDPASIADALRRALQLSNEERSAMGAAGRAYALTHFDRRVIADRYLNLLTALVGR